jgi:hypothetical protein
MTFATLIEEVLENILLTPGSENITRGEVKRLLNLAMREISLKVGVPILYLRVPSDNSFITGPFQMPLRIHPEGIKYAEVREVGEANTSAAEAMKNQEIAILSVQEANEFHPKFEDADYGGQPFLVYNPANPDSGIRPINIISARYCFLVHPVPEPMVEDGDTPFTVLDYCADPQNEGVPGLAAMPAFHRVLSHFVTHELLQRLNDQRWQAYYARYREMEESMFAHIQPTSVYLPTVRSGREVRRYA